MSEKTKIPFNLKITPGGWGNPLMEHAYVDFIRWAISHEPIIEDYKTSTGIDLYKLLPTNPLDAMIDEACSIKDDHRREQCMKFIEWLTINGWGEENGE